MKKFTEEQLKKMSNNEILNEINQYADKAESLKNEILKLMDVLIPKQQQLIEIEQQIDGKPSNESSGYLDKLEALNHEILKLMDVLIPKQQQLDEIEQEYARLIYYMKDNRLG